jgi:MFS family permease
MSMVQQFYGVYANKFLNDLHLPRPAGFQTIAQVGEVLCMAILPWVVDHWGMRKTMLAGLLGWTLRNALFSTCEVSIVSFVGLPIHGLSFAFFFVTAMIYVDRQAPRKLRASSQGIFTFISSGMGVLSGNMLAAWVVKLNTQGEMINWQPVWVVPMLMSAGVLVFFWIGFRPQLDKVHLEPGEAGKHLVEDIEELASAS